MNRTAGSALAAVVLLAGAPAHAAVIAADVTGCVLMTCTVEPTGGPVALDPTGFTLDVDWMPKHVELLGLDAGDWFALRLDFTFTGTHDGTENFGIITLLDETAGPVMNLNEQFDDTNAAVGALVANYQIFNNGVDLQSFFVHGFQLALSDGSGVDTLHWTGARFSPAAEGIWNDVPEPATVLLLGSGLAAAGVRRHRRRAA